jgi:hypothetical protein
VRSGGAGGGVAGTFTVESLSPELTSKSLLEELESLELESSLLEELSLEELELLLASSSSSPNIIF